MCRLYQSSKFVRWDHGDSPIALPAHDYDLMVVGDPVQHRGQTLTQVGIGSFCHFCPPNASVQDCCTYFKLLLYNLSVSHVPTTRLDRVLAQLRLYEHPLLNFSARAKGEGVEVIIKFKDESVLVHTYYFDLHPRDLDDSQFEWSFQRQLFDALHDYFVEMFIRTPQDRAERHRKGL
jgi:hypothetical protein